MNGRPKFKSDIHVKIIPPDVSIFLNESNYKIIQGRLFALIAPLINGKNSVSDIARLLKGKISRFDLDCGLLLLEGEGYITENENVSTTGITRLPFLPKTIVDRFKKTKTRVISFGSSSTKAFVSMLRARKMHITPDGDFTVVLVNNYLQEELAQFNRIAIREKFPWMIVKPRGNLLWFGPIFNPPFTGCWKCLAIRLQENLRAEPFSEAVRENDFPVLSNQVLRSAIKENYESLNQLQTFDRIEMKVQNHTVIRFDECPACGTSGGRAFRWLDAKARHQDKKSPERIVLNRSTKKSVTTESERGKSAERTFHKYQHHISNLTGVVRRLSVKAQGPVHICIAEHLLVPPTEREDVLRRGLFQNSIGKGLTMQEAKTTALCEALERYSGVFRGSEIRINSSFQELEENAIHPEILLNFSERQYRNRVKWNRLHSNHDWVPVPFDENEKIDWTPLWSLTNKTFKYVPTTYCYYGYPLKTENRFCRADSNGNAAGNTLEEAIVHGFLELVERDSAALWWFNRTIRPSLCIQDFADPFFKKFLQYYRTLGRTVSVLDITNDFKIPSFVAVSEKSKSASPEFLLGFGTHFNPRIAAMHALIEMHQFLLKQRVQKFKGKSLDFMKPHKKMQRTPDDFPKYQSDDFRKDVNKCVKLAQKLGMETLVLDQTRPDIGLSVVKVIVPGMRQFWARLCKGRLYDVPVQLGWLKEPLLENQLNPDHILI